MSFPIQQGLFKYELEDHYAILGVPLDADARQIRNRYLKIAYHLHPDTSRTLSPDERKIAGKILSKLVNPAYKVLSKDQSRAEYLLVLSQTCKNIAREIDRDVLTSEGALELFEAEQKAELTYHRLLSRIVKEQYDSLDRLFPLTAQLSELNLVYLAHKKVKGISAQPETSASKKSQPPDSGAAAPSIRQSSGAMSAGSQEAKSPTSPLENALRRAQDCINRNNYTQAIAELREVLKLDPNHSTCHSLLGIAYIRQNQMTMAKVHINKAFAANPKDPMAIAAKKELAAASPKESGKDGSDKGFLSGFFNTKKK